MASSQHTAKVSRRKVVIATAGKSGVGKSTLINNFLGLEEGQKSETGLHPMSITKKMKRFDGSVNDVNVEVIDIPGFGALESKHDTEAARVMGELSAFTGGRADVVLYCISLTSRMQRIDWENMNTLTEVYGKRIWKHVIFVFTWTDVILLDARRSLDDVVDDFMVELRRGLKANCKINIDIRSAQSFSESTEADINAFDGIICIPVSKDSNAPENWKSSLLLQVIRKCPSECIPDILQLTTNVTFEEIVDVLISAYPDLVEGASIGKDIGSLLGTLLENMYKLRGRDLPFNGTDVCAKLGSFIGCSVPFTTSVIMKVLSIMYARRKAAQQAHCLK